MQARKKADEIVWKSSPIKTDSDHVKRVHIGDKSNLGSAKTSLMQKLAYRSDMTKDEFSDFLQTALAMFEDDATPVKATRAAPQNAKISEEAQIRYDLLFASPNDSFQAEPYHYDEEDDDAPRGMVTIMEGSMEDEEREPAFAANVPEVDDDYRHIIQRITSSNKANNGIPHPYATTSVNDSRVEDNDELRTTDRPSLHQYDPEASVNAASRREIETNNNSISFGDNFLQTLTDAVADADRSIESIDLSAIVARNREVVSTRGASLAVSEAQKYLNERSPTAKKLSGRPTPPAVPLSSSAAGTSSSLSLTARVLTQNREPDRSAQLVDPEMLPHWECLETSQVYIQQMMDRGARVTHFDEDLRVHFSKLRRMSPDALQSIVFLQHDKLVQDGIFSGV